MVVRKHKKVTKQRGSRTHGWGLVHRGSGQRGGAGNAGRGKKAHCKKPQVWKERYLGKLGFIFHGKQKKVVPITLKNVEEKLNGWNAQQLVQKQQDTFVVDLSKLGYTKLLSTGKVTKKLQLIIEQSSPKAIKKVEAQGGKVVLPAP